MCRFCGLRFGVFRIGGSLWGFIAVFPVCWICCFSCLILTVTCGVGFILFLLLFGFCDLVFFCDDLFTLWVGRIAYELTWICCRFAVMGLCVY